MSGAPAPTPAGSAPPHRPSGRIGSDVASPARPDSSGRASCLRSSGSSCFFPTLRGIEKRFLTMRNRDIVMPGLGLALLSGGLLVVGLARGAQERAGAPPHDAIAEAQTPRAVPNQQRPEQALTKHD